MHKQPGSVRLSRRAFLRRFGVAATALAAGQLVSACSGHQASASALDRGAASQPMAANFAAAQQGTLRVGVLLPQSQLYPMIGANFRAGMELYLAQARDDQRSRRRKVELYPQPASPLRHHRSRPISARCRRASA
jgi:hypothetical protein